MDSLTETSPFKFCQVNFPQKTGPELFLWMIKCVYFINCANCVQFLFVKKLVLSFSRPVFSSQIWSGGQFSKTPYFSDQKISKSLTHDHKKRTLINAHYFIEHLKKSIIFHQHIKKSNPMWPIKKILNNDALCECFVPRKQFLFSG